ncbi:hypothetical protein JCM8547_003128 [Rhodosporidiobolus lusitaniae]
MPALVQTATTSSSSPLVGSKPKRSFLGRLLSSTSPSSSTPQDPEAIFREIMALNARHGAPEVQAYVRYSPKPPAPSRSSSTSSSSSSSSPFAESSLPHPPRYTKRPTPSPQEQFDEIMRLNRKHGHPSVQAFSPR